jgi:hypothetical protein
MLRALHRTFGLSALACQRGAQVQTGRTPVIPLILTHHWLSSPHAPRRLRSTAQIGEGGMGLFRHSEGHSALSSYRLTSFRSS